jgi:hypothetical protein
MLDAMMPAQKYPLPRKVKSVRVSRMRILNYRKVVVPASALMVALLLNACSADAVSDFKTPSFMKGLNVIIPLSKETEESAPVRKHEPTPAELVDANGACVAAGSNSAPAATAPTFEMSECSVVQLLGPPQRIEIGANERGDRTAVMYFSKGQRPGIYRFTDAQLKSIERIGEPAAPAKPQKPAKPAKQAPLRRAT